MKKIYLIIIILSSWFGNNNLQAQCSVNISTIPNTTGLNCNNTIITLKANAAGSGKITYLWSTGETNASIKVKDSGNYSVKITAGGGCTSSSSIKITKDITIPDVSILAFPDIICSGSSSTLVAIGADSYKWIPGQLTGAAITVSPAITTNYIVTGTASNGCKGQDSFNLVVNPLPAAGISGDSSLCQDATEPPITFKGSNGTAPYTFTYNINNGSAQAITTSGTSASVTVNASTASIGILSYNLIAVTDANGCRQSQSGTVSVKVLSAPALTSVKEKSVCDSSLFKYKATSSVANTIFSWTRDAVSGISNPAATKTGSVINEMLYNTTDQPVTVNYVFTLSTGTGCITTDTLKLIVNPTPKINPITNYTFCNGVLAAIDSFTSNSPNVAFKWYNSKTAIGLADSGVGNILPFIAKNNKPGTITGTVTVKITTSKTCPGPETNFTIKVLPALVLTSPKTASICDSTKFTYKAASSDTGTQFTWVRLPDSNITPAPGPDSNKTDSINEILHNKTDSPIVVNYVFISKTVTGCTTTDILKLTVNPTPIIKPIRDYIFCNGGLATLDSFKSSSPNAAFKWSNSNPAIGLTDSGIGNIFPFIAVNNSPDTIATGTVIVKITASSDNCPGPDSIFTIKVRPALVLTSVKTKSICNDDSVKYTAISSVANTTFSWKRDSINGISNRKDSVGGAVINEPLHNTTDIPVVVNYVFYLATKGADCVATDTLKITVNPPPKINPIPDYFFCDGDTSSIPITGNIKDASITWQLTNGVSIGLPASGTGSIPVFRATNTDTTAIIANLTANIKVGDNGKCEGGPEQFNITVYPRAKLVSSKDTSICDSTKIIYTAKSSAANTIFSWTRPFVPGISNPEKVNVPGAVIDETLDNTKLSQKTVRYSFTLKTDIAAGCSYKDSLKVIVNPTPILTPINDTVFCNNELVKAIPFTGTPSDADFKWTNTNINIGLTDTGFGNITGFIATNTSDKPITGTIKVNITYSSLQCPGQPDSFIVKVNPSAAKPYFTSLVPYNDTLKLCNGSNNISFNINAPVTGTDYKWASSERDTNIVHIKDSLYANTVISFLKLRPGDFYKITARAINTVNGGCDDTISQVVKLLETDGIVERAIFKKQPGNLLIYPDNSLTTYQWGYDSVINMNKKIFSPSVPIAGQVYQFFIPDIKFLNGEELNETDYLYWVALTNGTCYSKVYYNGPYVGDNLQAVPLPGGTPQLRVIPNPNNGVFEIVLSGNIYGNINAKIYNATGRAVYMKNFSKFTQSVNEKFVTGNLVSGFYFIELYSSDLKKVVSRFLIQR